MPPAAPRSSLTTRCRGLDLDFDNSRDSDIDIRIIVRYSKKVNVELAAQLCSDQLSPVTRLPSVPQSDTPNVTNLDFGRPKRRYLYLHINSIEPHQLLSMPHKTAYGG